MKKIQILLFFAFLHTINLKSQTMLFFKNTEHGYSFKYLNSFIKYTSKNPSVEFSAKNINGASIVTNTEPFNFSEKIFKNITQKTIENDIKTQVDFFSITKFIKKTVSGCESIVVYCDVTVGKRSLSQIIIFVNSKSYHLTVTCSSLKNDFTSLRTSFEKTISSLAL